MDIIKLAKSLYRTSKHLVELTGITFVCIMSVFSIALLKGATIPVSVRLDSLLKSHPYMPCIWLGILAVYTGGFIIEGLLWLTKLPSKYKQEKEKATAQHHSLLESVLGWLIRN